MNKNTIIIKIKPYKVVCRHGNITDEEFSRIISKQLTYLQRSTRGRKLFRRIRLKNTFISFSNRIGYIFGAIKAALGSDFSEINRRQDISRTWLRFPLKVIKSKGAEEFSK